MWWWSESGNVVASLEHGIPLKKMQRAAGTPPLWPCVVIMKKASESKLKNALQVAPPLIQDRPGIEMSMG